MVVISDELVNVLLAAGYEDGLKLQIRTFLMNSDWYMLGQALAREEGSYEDLN